MGEIFLGYLILNETSTLRQCISSFSSLSCSVLMLQLPKLYQNEMEMAYVTVTWFLFWWIHWMLAVTHYLHTSATLKTSESNCVKTASVEGKVLADLKCKPVEGGLHMTVKQVFKTIPYLLTDECRSYERYLSYDSFYLIPAPHPRHGTQSIGVCKRRA